MLAHQGATLTGASASPQQIKLVTARHPQPVLPRRLIVPDLVSAMKGFQAALGIEWRPPDTPTCCRTQRLRRQRLTGLRMTNNQAATKVEHPRVRPSPEWPHPRERTGVRFVLTNVTDPSHANDYGAWYDDYENAIIRPGGIANAFRFENPDAAGSETDPRYAAIYDIVSPDPALAWPATENSPDYPTHLFADPRSRLVAPALRGSYAMTGSMEIDNDERALSGVHT